MQLSALDENGKPVDWWFAYKVAGKSQTSRGVTVTGVEYVYFDANAPADAKLVLSSHHVDKDGMLPSTLSQLYVEEGLSTQHMGWFFYNDENPIDGTVSSSRGHSKGVLAFDLGSDTAFWLIQSTPKFPPKGSYGFPKTGLPNAQTLLCVTLQNADVAQSIAKQMFAAQQPNVYLASRIPVDLENQPNDPRVKLIQDQAAVGNTPLSVVIPFRSKSGTKFLSIAKNPTWGLDFYNDLVGPTLHDNLDVETWEHDPTPPPLDSDKIHTVVDMKGIDLKPLGIGISWPEPDDHAKLAISARSETDHYVCVGDMNFVIAQRKRGGGTVAFQCEPLWSSISAILVGVTTHLKPGSKAALLQSRRQSASAAKATSRQARSTTGRMRKS
jgi:deoxyribonuclease-2